MGAGNTWADVAPSPDTWADIGATTQSWIDFYDIEAAPTVNMTLAWDDTSRSNWDDYANYAYNLEILTAVTNGRYYRLMIEIADPLPAINAYVEEFDMHWFTLIS